MNQKLPLFVILALTSLPIGARAATDKYRLIWNQSPESSATVAWCQKDDASAAVHYAEAAPGNTAPPELNLTRGIDHKTSHLNLESRFARLTGLKPDTVYHFVIRDSNSESPRFWFKTAPAAESSFSFVAGGDSRNHRDARQNANRTVAKLRPLFVSFGGDMIDKPTPEEWADWFDDWQLTVAADGRITPIIAARGNHEGPADIHSFFDTPTPDDYYALDIGKNFLRFYTLNSNITRAGSQSRWLAEDLAASSGHRWKIAQYHHPFRPHQAKKAEQDAQYNAWAPLFFEHGLDLAIECDSHVVKRTWPLRPSNAPGSEMGFIRDDLFGTTFIGEGCWGAPLRRNDDDKSWTRASGSFNQIHWITVGPAQITERNVLVDSIGDAGELDPANPYALPDGLKIWEPETGADLVIHPRSKDGRQPLPVGSLARINIIASGEEFAANGTVRIVAAGEIVAGASIRYTLDGSEPTASSPPYSAPFQIKSPTTIRAALFLGDSPVTKSVALRATPANTSP